MKNNISVIIPLYNTKDYFKQAIDSILDQSEYISEIIVINDGSTDGSGKMLESYYGKNELVKIYHTENKGQGHARNYGTDFSNGEFIYYFDSDDISSNRLFATFHNTLNKNLDIELFCFSGDSFLDESVINTKQNFDFLNDAYKRKLNLTCNSGEEAFQLLVKNNSFFPGPPLYIFKKNILLKNKVRFNPTRYEDEAFTHKLFLFAGKTVITNDIFFKRRIRADSTMQIKRSFKDLEGYFDTIDSLISLKSYFISKPETIKILNDRIQIFIKLIIKIKAQSKLKLSFKEKKIYYSKLFPSISKDLALFMFFLKYPLEYQLRLLKTKIIG